MANDAHEDFFGCTLTKDKKEYIWDPNADSEEDVEHKLQLTSACLGHKAKDGERNILEVTTEDDVGKKITCPIVSLRVGGKECTHLDLGFFNATKFTLKEGSGPISLCGVHLKALPLDFDENEDSSEDEEVPDLIPAAKKETKKPVEKKGTKPAENNETKQGSQTKRPLPADKKNEKPAKKAKVVEPEPEESDDEEDDEEEDEDMSDDDEEPSLLDAQAEEASDEEDSEEGDDEPEEGDDVESDEDDEEMESDENDMESDDEEESEEEEAPQKKKPKVNGHTPKSTPGKGGPQKNKDKTPAAEAKTPTAKKTPGKKDTTTTPKSQAKKTPDELKIFLLKSPNLPKKFDKFANFMKNNMKVTDEKSQKELWDYVQINKK